MLILKAFPGGCILALCFCSPWCCGRLPLGVPSQLPMDALDLAERLIEHPGSQHTAGRAVEREAGYILLGALCIALPVQVLVVSEIRSLSGTMSSTSSRNIYTY